jgi:hypothetical protein
MRTTVLAAALLLAGCDGPLLFAELEIPDIRITLPSQTFPGTSTALPQDWCAATPECVEKELSFDLGAEVPVVTEPNVTYHLRLTSVAIVLSATSLGTPLGGIEAVQISVLDPQSGEGVVVASYEKTTESPTEIRVAGNSSIELGRYIAAGALQVRVELTYDLSNPTPEFQADVETGFAFDAKLDWGAYL